MLSTITAPKIYNDFERNLPGFEEKHSLRNKILYQIHEIDLGLNRSIYASVQKFFYTWIHRFLQFPEEQVVVWHLCYIFLMSLLCLPWFRTELIPSGKDQAEKMGNFYMWGLLFDGDQWIPLADTWLFSIFTLTFDIGVFILFFIWKSTSLHLLVCKGVERKSTSLVCDRIWFQLLLVVYWLWRLMGVSDLATFYGGVWPTLVMNLLIWWLIFVAVVTVFGKNGILVALMSRSKGQDSQPLGMNLEICPACHDGSADEPENIYFGSVSQNNVDEREQLHHIDITTQEAESQFLLSDGGNSDSSTSSASRKPVRRATSKKD